MKNIIITGFAVLFMITAGCSGTTTQKAPTKKGEKQYTCTMHPEVIKNKPGVCPKCGMDLVDKDN